LKPNERASQGQGATWHHQQQGLLLENCFHTLLSFFPFKQKENRLCSEEGKKGRSKIKLSAVGPVSDQ